MCEINSNKIFQDEISKEEFEKKYSSEKNRYILNSDGTVTIITNATNIHDKNDKESFIDNNEELLMHLRKYKITYDTCNEGYFKAYLNGENNKLHYLIYEFITGEKVDTSKYEIDHLNSNPKDNTFNNLIKIEKELHYIKLKAIKEFVFPYTIDLKMNDTKDKFMVILCDLGVSDNSPDYANNYLLFLEYDNINDLIFDLDLYKIHQMTYPENEKICKNIKMDENIKLKIRIRSKKNKAINMVEAKMTKDKYDKCVSTYIY
ncbi:hypothetical protein JMF89_01265 [Clostridiaceae bacterium UIB06]|uniref:HNH nuclease domain-containing protein n=1 Tax=Clostridium thailandense TaxID=2794346 RepID=A0A949WTC9_9CLOT|nr:HNH endonuclease [Clostridium thailandense]MBV7276051.1 hypothetical protein [Clostridium thailandense]MCH5135844.1 hypothetical protein [Clostridiaceae bacterium UIB06]